MTGPEDRVWEPRSGVQHKILPGCEGCVAAPRHVKKGLVGVCSVRASFLEEVSPVLFMPIFLKAVEL